MEYFNLELINRNSLILKDIYKNKRKKNEEHTNIFHSICAAFEILKLLDFNTIIYTPISRDFIYSQTERFIF